MKKALVPVFTAIVIVILFFPACKKSSDNNNGPVDSIPTFTMSSVSGFISKDTTLPARSQIRFSITANSSGTKAPLTHLYITRTFASKPNIVLDSSFSATSLNHSFSDYANSEVGPEQWSFRITDQLNKSKEISFVITTTAK
jgi:hypothetical protein